MYTDLSETLSKNLPFWKNLTNDEKTMILNNSKRVSYAKGTIIHGGTTDCLGAVLVCRGELCAYLLSEEGREIALYHLFHGEFCVLSASCVMSEITFDIHIDAEEDSEIILIDLGTFSKISKQNIYAECFTYKMAAQRFSDVMWVMQQILFFGYDRRLAIYLTDECAKNGTNVIKSTHEQIAKYTSSAREVASRMLKRFEQEGIVKLDRKEIVVLNKEKLRSIAIG